MDATIAGGPPGGCGGSSSAGMADPAMAQLVPMRKQRGVVVMEHHVTIRTPWVLAMLSDSATWARLSRWPRMLPRLGAAGAFEALHWGRCRVVLIGALARRRLPPGGGAPAARHGPGVVDGPLVPTWSCPRRRTHRSPWMKGCSEVISFHVKLWPRCLGEGPPFGKGSPKGFWVLGDLICRRTFLASCMIAALPQSSQIKI